MTGIEYQTSIFDIMDQGKPDDLEKTICSGSGFEGGRIRIYAAALSLPMNKLVEFLKNEYGIGGRSMDYGFMDYNASGIRMTLYKGGRGGERREQLIKWPEAASLIKKYIGAGRYLKPKEQKTIDELRAKYGNELPVPYPKYGFK